MKEIKNVYDFNDISKLYKNTLVIHCLDIVKLIDIEEDEQDYYFVYETLKKGKFSSSIIIDFIPLIDSLPKDDYESIQSMWDLNYEEVEENIIEDNLIKDELQLIKEDIVLIKNKLNI
jgi:hypothetical protein